MSHLKYSSYPGYGDFAKEHFYYNQAVRIGDFIEISGQGGWDRSSDGTKISPDLKEDIVQAFNNVEATLKDAGASGGWEHVYKVNSYHVGDCLAGIEIMTELMKKYCPNHRPTWTAVGVTELGIKEMKVEIEVRAHVGSGLNE